MPGNTGALARDYHGALSELTPKTLEGLRSYLLAKHCEGLAIDNPEGRDGFQAPNLGELTIICCTWNMDTRSSAIRTCARRRAKATPREARSPPAASALR